jgi:hypothetical protein
MNKQRRKELDRAVSLINEAQSIVSFEADAENSYREDAPENLYYSEKFERAEEVALELETIADDLGEFESRVEELKEAF